ncbi:NAD(P)-dependent oxidoreductase [Blattabacterium cuenoti]|uniref:NAD(P)-dependent oxidoreductase n=1 Tax=Blattabacterium cuenoti TaxID=1653831 RepID=UPI00163D2DEF|nr:NAD(P)-dependent oxidoreductase [Blattabacterium cuenoti]
MTNKRILILDKIHPFILKKLRINGFFCNEKYSESEEEIKKTIFSYNGIILKSRLKIDKNFLNKAMNLKFIARVGSGIENIDQEYAYKKNIKLITSPEGNKDSVAEHAIGMLLSIMNHICISNEEIRKGKWNRELNKGKEIKGKTIGIIGYGNTGKAFAKKISSFNAKILCYDILPNKGDQNAIQVDINKIYKESDIISLHIPYTRNTKGMINENFIKNFKKPFYLINTSRGKCVFIDHLINAIKYGKILGACLDVIDYESNLFENLFRNKKFSKKFYNFLQSKNIILTPHIAGLTKESERKMANIIVKKIFSIYNSFSYM